MSSKEAQAVWENCYINSWMLAIRVSSANSSHKRLPFRCARQSMVNWLVYKSERTYHYNLLFLPLQPLVIFVIFPRPPDLHPILPSCIPAYLPFVIDLQCPSLLMYAVRICYINSHC